jgi:hypothetical protein
MNTPQLLHLMCHTHYYQPNLKAQARFQTQQIDSAIQLLKIQYDAIMSSVQQSQSPLPRISVTSTQVVDQTSFSAQFELPGPASDEQVATAREMETSSFKRQWDNIQPDGISIKRLMDPESGLTSKTSESNLRPTKRLRKQ